MAPGGQGSRETKRASVPVARARGETRQADAGRDTYLEVSLDASGTSYLLLKAVRDGDTVIDWDVLDVNERVRQRWAGALGELVGLRMSAMNAVADNSDYAEHFAAALACGQTREFDTELSLPGGQSEWRRNVVVPLDADTVSVTSHDVSRERYLEHALERERQAYKALARGAAGRGGTTPGPELRLLSRTASGLFLGAGAVALLNSLLADLPGVNMLDVRLTGILTMLSAAVVPLLPWRRHARMVALSLIASGILFLVVSDQFTHYSRSESAVAVYPVFFIMIVAWSGLTQVRAMPIVVALVSALSLAGLFSEGHQTTVGLECVLVTMPAAAALGEVLAWSHRRAAGLAQLEAERRLRDPLTGLANRHLFSECLDQALARVRRDRQPLAVLFIDLDRFKQVNDSLGHGAGDELLVEVADRLRLAVREQDLVARFGGDEFAVLCEDLDTETDAAEVAARVLNAFEAPFSCGKRDVYTSASMGIAVSGSGREGPEALLQDADAAMYRAKDGGRRRFEVFDETMRHWVAARLELESALRQAIDQDELRVQFQPIVGSDSLAVEGFEALVRWERPGVGLVEPGKFIPVAEETGMVFAIGELVMHEACRQAVAWSEGRAGPPLRVAVNVSSRQLLKGDIVDVVRRALAASGLDPELLTLELTETTLIDDAVTAQSVLYALRALGVKIALDDFGTGYSSLTYLRTFPIDTIKIDESFVRTIDASRAEAAIVAAVVQLAGKLGIEVVAEGIETEAQLDAVVALGCGSLQGFLFSPPVPSDQVAGLLARFEDPDRRHGAVSAPR